MSDTQKTTKGVREAPTASRKPFRFPATIIVEAPTETDAENLANHRIERANQNQDFPDCKLERGFDFTEQLKSNYEKALGDLAKPRYTVELTTEGWQIKDNEKNNYGGDAYGSKATAQAEADAANRFETDWPR